MQSCREESATLHPFQLWFVDTAELVLLTFAETCESDSEIPAGPTSTDQMVFGSVPWKINAASQWGGLYPK